MGRNCRLCLRLCRPALGSAALAAHLGGLHMASTRLSHRELIVSKARGEEIGGAKGGS